MTPWTRQKAGMVLKFATDPGPPRGVPFGNVNAPAATVCAVVIVVEGSFKLARLSQVAANIGAAVSVTPKTRCSQIRIFIVLCPFELGFPF